MPAPLSQPRTLSETEFLVLQESNVRVHCQARRFERKPDTLSCASDLHSQCCLKIHRLGRVGSVSELLLNARFPIPRALACKIRDTMPTLIKCVNISPTDGGRHD